MASWTDEIFIVAAIDFGTSHSGYLFSFNRDPDHFFTPSWFGEHGTTTVKTPTCLLMNPDQSFNSFGSEALDRYSSLAADGEHTNYYYFENFKMNLHFKTINRNSLIADVTGKSVSAMKVFSLSIKFLKDHCLQTMRDRGINVKTHDIKFVLTVPAIWNDRSKQFMREVAVEAGIKNETLSLALEPEAASIYCQRISLDKVGLGKDAKITTPGTQYLIADIGGGIANFSVHEVNDDGSLTELHPACGGPYGSVYVNEEFLKIFDIIFGPEAMKKLQLEDMEKFLSLIKTFEIKKKLVGSNYKNSYNIQISPFLNEALTVEDIKTAIHSFSLMDKVSVFKGRLRISPKLMKSFFDSSLSQIIDTVHAILKRLPTVKNILVVGGYGESKLLQERINSEFPQHKIIIPKDCSSAVLKGAVLFGHNPMSIAARVLRYTYGIKVNPLFDPVMHPIEKRYIDKNGEERCEDVFWKIIDKGSIYPSIGIEVLYSNNLLPKQDKKIILSVYCTQNDHPFIIDETFQFLGNVTFFVPEHINELWPIDGKFVFGMTELSVFGNALQTGEKIPSTFDLLE